MSGAWFTRQIRLVVIFIAAIMLPTILLGYLAIRTAETEKLVVWEKLKESYTSLANGLSNQLDDTLYSAESDFRHSVSALTTYDRDILQRSARQLEDEHGVIGHVFFLNSSGDMIFPEDPRGKRRDVEAMAELSESQRRDKDIFESYVAEAERQEFKHNDPQRAIYGYQRILDDLKMPIYRTLALNGIARCYTRLGSDKEALKYYNEIISKYTDVTDGWANIAAIAYLQAASIYGKMGNADAAVETLMGLHKNLSENIWHLDAEGMSYLADRTRHQLQVYMEGTDEKLNTLADRFSEIDRAVARQVKLQRFLKDYQHLASEEIKHIARSATEGPGSMQHLIRYRSLYGPYLVSYLPGLPAGRSPDAPALAGFEVDLDYMASQRFREVLSDFTIEDDVVLTIMDEDNGIVAATHVSSIQRENRDFIPPGEPIAMVASPSLPFWKVGIYVEDPLSLERLSKRKASLRIAMIVGLVLAIAFGIYLSLREARRETELARMRSDFVANVSHELRTPLSSIQIFSETLRQNRASREKQEQYLDTIASESDRLARLVDNVLDFSRLERRVKQFDFQPTDVGEVVESAVEACRFYAEQRGAGINLDVAPDMPEIQADREAISQMVTNLIDNAVKYSEGEAEITIRAFLRGGKIVIQVADKGVGIDEEDAKRIFDKFYRGKNVANLGTGGTGLGLTLARAVAIAHGGDILVKSKRGVGSRFSVILPVSVNSNE